ncbi:MAG TPA: aldehyde dehydrogenase family protein [Vicinamibacteria bacterium]|nr:aldehyde dehydrogenase family protein [Vicinamibacteria bacterium]
MGDTWGNYIGGSWRDAASGRTFEDLNPADTDDCLGRFADSGPEDAASAVAAAKAAFPAWKRLPAPKRGEILFRAAEILGRRKEALARDMTREMGKVLAETRGDVQEAIDMTYYMAGEGRRQFGQTTPSELRDKFQMSVRMPVGVAGLVTPWNFPMAIPSWKAMPALVLGNTVVLKAAPDTPLSAVNLVRALEEAGLPPGVLNLVTGGSEPGAALVTHPDVGVVSFTGSTTTGRSVSEAAARAFKHCHLEMGGKNVILVMDDADLELAVDGAVWGGFGTSGQRCTAASRVVLHRAVYDAFARRFVERAQALRVGDGLQAGTDMGPVVSEAQLRRIEGYVELGRAEGARLLCGGRRLSEGSHARGFFHEPTVFGDVSPHMRIAREEIFGPVVALIPVGSLEEAVAVGNSVDYGLSASIYTRDIGNAFRAMQEMYTGIFYVNAPTIGAETHLPFGGTKATGNGHREACVQALDVFSEWKSVYIDFSGALQRAQID